MTSDAEGLKILIPIFILCVIVTIWAHRGYTKLKAEIKEEEKEDK